ncbi:hypothetical protein [Zeaxanthinibacter enoshimensis]|uniref:hypothetical protein n=1 Tax=Zeaxanthinibacter enoshimensis TaxID=392009 RepID=UPI0035632146
MNFNFSPSTKRAITGAVIAMAILGAGNFMLGELSGYEAKTLIRHSVSGINTLCNTIVLASATILALLLTVLSLSSGTKNRLKREHYEHIMQIAKFDTWVLIGALSTFLLFNLPITESENVPTNWFTIVYYASLGMTSIMSAALIVVVIMLYNTVVSMIKIVGLGQEDHPLMDVKEEEEKEEEKKEKEKKKEEELDKKSD